jgi:Flp pilus assembly protein CpaB
MPTLSKNIVISVALAVAAAIALVFYVNQVRDQASSGQRLMQVVVAKTSIPAGTTIDDAIAAGEFAARTVRAQDAPQGAVTSLDGFRGQVVSGELFQGDVVTTNRLSSFQSQGWSYQVTGPDRLIRVPLFDTQGLLSDAQVGDKVDIFSITTTGDGTKQYEQMIVPGAQIMQITSPSDAAAAGNSSAQGSLLLRMTVEETARVAAALSADSGGNSDNNIWIVLSGRRNATYPPFPPVRIVHN